MATRQGENLVQPLFGAIDRFDISKPKDWPDYLQEVNVFFACNDLDNASEAKQCSVFCQIIGPDSFRLLRSLIAPAVYTAKTLRQLQNTLTEHFAPTRSVVFHSFKFWTRNQGTNETVNEYVAALRSLANKCDYGALLDRLLRDRFITGIRSPELQQKLLQDSTITIQTAIDQANAFEIAISSSTILQTPSISSPAQNNSSDVLKIQSKFQSKKSPKKYRSSNSRRSSSVSNQNNSNSSNIRACFGCGEKHLRDACPHKTSTCFTCGKMGHLATVCRSKKTSQRTNSVSLNNDSYTINSVRKNINNGKSLSVFVNINNFKIRLEIDSGSAVTLINETSFKLMNRCYKTQLHNFEGILRTVSGKQLSVVGKANVDVKYGTNCVNLPLIVVRGNSPNLLGRSWFDSLGIFIGGVHCLSDHPSISNVIEKYSDIFKQDLGQFKGTPVDFVLDQNIPPIFCKPRRVPFGKIAQVDDAIDELISKGVFVPTDSTTWGTPLVPVEKSDGSIRLCADYKVTINKALRPHPQQIPLVNQLAMNLQGCEVFAELDLAQAYLQLPVTDRAAEAQTVVTHRGAFRVTRLQFGVSTAPGEFQSRMEKLMYGLQGVVVYFDNIFVGAKNIQNLSEILDKVLNRINNEGLRLKKEKCRFGVKSIQFLGHTLSAKGMSPDLSKIEAVQKMRSPTSKKEVQIFLGKLNFLHNFLKNKANIAQPLHQLLHKNTPWKWTKVHEKAFNDCKNLLSSDSILVNFDPALPLVLICDASPVGVGSVLCHKFGNGSEKPIAFYSRSLSKAEMNYAQIDREALALVASVKKFHNYLYGFNFELVTDHKPLLGLFGKNKPTPEIMSPRMYRWSHILSAYEYKLSHRPGVKIPHVDTLSRLPLPSPDPYIPPLHDVFLIEIDHKLPVNANMIALETKRDVVLSRVYDYSMRGWPNAFVPPELKDYWQHRNVISTYRGCLIYGNRTIVPLKFRKTLLEALHTSHPGMTRMKSLARMYAWWPTINAEIAEFVSNCRNCQSYSDAESRVPPIPWAKSLKPWERIHVDFAGPFKGKILFLVVDSYSKWLDVTLVKTTSTQCAIDSLRLLFATHGLPKTIVSDNGSAFTSDIFRTFCKSNFINLIFTAPYHPSSNGQAERMVKTTKINLQKMFFELSVVNDQVWKHSLARFLLTQHITPAYDGLSPSEMLMNRRLRTILDAVLPDSNSHPSEKDNSQNAPNTNPTNLRDFENGDRVIIRNYGQGPSWVPAQVVSRMSSVNYRLQTGEGGEVSRHADQIKKDNSTSSNTNSPANSTPSKTTADTSIDYESCIDKSQTCASTPCVQSQSSSEDDPSRKQPKRKCRRNVQFEVSESSDSSNCTNFDTTYKPSTYQKKMLHKK